MKCLPGLILGFVLSGVTVFAGETNSAWLLHVWASDDGLPNNTVNSLAQTDDGYLWAASGGRLTRFDGARFQDFFSDRVEPDLHQKIVALLRSRTGGLWLGMERGAIIYLHGEKSRIFTNGLPSEYPQVLLEDGDGALWISYRGGAVCRLANGVVTSFGPAEGLPGSFPCWLAADSGGHIWFAQGSVVGTFREGRFSELYDVRRRTTGLTIGAGDVIWIAADHHLFRSDKNRQLQDCGDFDPGPVNPARTLMLEDSSRAIWIGTTDGGLFRYDGSKFENISVSHQEVLSLLEDREKNLWVGTGGGGLDRIRPSVISLEGTGNGLPFEALQSLCEDTAGTVWATTQNGIVVRREQGSWHTEIPARVDSGMASCVAAGTNGEVWIGTRSGALRRWKAGELTTWHQDDGLAGRAILALLVSKSGDVWLGEENPESAQRFHDGKFFSFKLPPNVRVIRALAEDAAGNIWAGTSRGVLLRFTGDQVFDETSNTGGASPLSIRCLRATRDGALWIGYAGDGLGRLKDGRFARFSVEKGLFDGTISQIVPDDHGWMWFGADHGLFKVRRNELNDVMDGHGSSIQCIRYGRDQDLPSLEANFGESPGALHTRDGRLWIPMRTALAVIDPNKIPPGGTPATALLEQATVDGHVLAFYCGVLPPAGTMDLAGPDARLQLPPGHHSLEFKFSAPNLSDPENLRFRYRLAGLDDHWVEAGTQRTATYLRLPAGSYEFQVAACNSDGVWSDTKAGVAVVVAPYVWQTWWFRFMILAAFTAAVAGIARYISIHRLRLKLQKLEQQTALERERARIARDIHDDLGGRLTELELLIELVRRTPSEKLNGQMGEISATVRQVGASLDEIVWAANPRNDSLPHLMDYLNQYAVRFLQTADIRCRTDFPDEFPQLPMPPEARHNLFLAVKEALNNVARHAGATEIWLRASFANGLLSVVIEDNGKGFSSTAEDPCADGLRNMRQRMEEIGGSFRVETSPGGTRVSMTLPFPPKTKSAIKFTEQK